MLLQKLLNNSIFIRYLLNGAFKTLSIIVLFNILFFFISYEYSLLISILIVTLIFYYINIRYVFRVGLIFNNFIFQLFISIGYYFCSVYVMDLLFLYFNFDLRICQILSIVLLFPLTYLVTNLIFKKINS